MRTGSHPIVLAVACLSLAASVLGAEPLGYPWLGTKKVTANIENSIAPPKGYYRTKVAKASFADWLRRLPLREAGAPVLLHTGRQKTNQRAHFRVVDIDTGRRNLQQCADIVIRLRAEHLFLRQLYSAIHFNFTSGDEASFTRWAAGYRAIVRGNKVRWAKTAESDSSYENFRKYLITVFVYAGTLSLSKELVARKSVQDMTIGDVFIRGGSPGHAVIVVDMAVDRRSGHKVFLIAQSYMPAQDLHILKNPTDPDRSPWYRLDFGTTLKTPEWTFRKNELMRFGAERE